MAKIPRLQGSEASAGIPGAALSSPGSVALPTEALGNIAETGYKIASDAEAVEAAKLQRALEAKQAVVNEVDAGRRAGDYEESLYSTMEGLKTQYADAPDQAPAKLLEIGRAAADKQLENAPNSAVGLAVAQRANSRLDAAMKEMHNWAQARLTQKAKGDLDVQINQFTAVAERQPNVAALSNYLATADEKLGSQFAKVLGADASKRMYEMRAAAVDGWARVNGAKEPFVVANALENPDPENPLIKYANTDARKSLRSGLEASAEGLTKHREYEQIKRDIGHGGKIAEAYLSGNPEFAGIVVSERTSIAQQRLALAAKLKHDEAAFKALGIDPKGKTDEGLLALLDDREKFVNALDHANRRQISLTAQDDPASVGALMVQMNKALKSRNGKDMAAIAKQQTNVAVALAGERISGATATQMFQTMALAMQTASENQEDVWGPNTTKRFHAPREAGIAELNRQLGGTWEQVAGGGAVEQAVSGSVPILRGPYSSLSPETKAAIRLDYEALFNAAVTNKQAVDSKATRRMALRAISYRTGKHIPGAD